MRIGLFGTFDVENYGDLLFPLIAEGELRQRMPDLELVRYSYNEKRAPSWIYDVTSLADLLQDSKSGDALDAILIGGGHLIRFDKPVAAGYGPPIPEIAHPSGYWLAPALAAIAAGRPVLWNAPGASDELEPWAHGILTHALNNSAYVSVRDASSLQALRGAGFQGPCSVVPDTAFAVARHFPRESRRDRVAGLLSSAGITGKYLVVQGAPSLESNGHVVLQASRLLSDFQILGLPIGPVLRDDASYVQRLLPGAKSLWTWPTPEQIAGLIALSSGVIGVSLHLSITALAYGLPVLRPAAFKAGKYAQLQSARDVYWAAPDDLNSIRGFAGAVRSDTPSISAVVTEAQHKLASHWDTIAGICIDSEGHRRSLGKAYAEANLLLMREEVRAQQRPDLERMQVARVDPQAARQGSVIPTVQTDKAKPPALPQVTKRHDTAVILHLYYADMWDGIRSYLSNLNDQFDLFVTVPAGADVSDRQVTAGFPLAHILHSENRGRDVAPFLSILSAISGLGYQYVCKIHTKKSPHLEGRGSEWLNDMLDKLLGSPALISQIKGAFDLHDDWGLIAPQGHVVPHNLFWRPNEATVTRLARMAGINTPDLAFSFVAGSMFWFRPQVFAPLVDLDLCPDDFEPELGQQDGTLAHAIERLFGLLATAGGYTIAESGLDDVRPSEISFQMRTLVVEMQRLEDQVFPIRSQLAQRQQEVRALSDQVAEKERQWRELTGSAGWRILGALHRIRLWFAPEGTRRERMWQLMLSGLKLWKSQGFRAFTRRGVDRIRGQIRRLSGERDAAGPTPSNDSSGRAT